MCGIFGYLHFSPNSQGTSDSERALEAIKHRGPDEEGKWQGEGIFLGMRRLMVLVDDAVADRARLVVSCADADRICRGRIEVDACDLDLVAVEVRQELAAEERWVQTAECGRLPRRESAREGDVGICGQRRRAVLQPRTGGRAAHRARDRSEHRRLARRLGPVGVGPRGEVVPGVEHVSDARHLTLLRDPARRRHSDRALPAISATCRSA